MGFFAPLQVFALGLGELQTQSALNQPFVAELQVLRASPAELKELKVSLASDEDYARIGLERLPILNSLRFKLIKKGSTHYIRISSQQAISEPYLNFLIEVNWSRGRLLREFTVLLDPPELLGSGAPELTSPRAESTPQPISSRSPVPSAPTEATEASDNGIIYGPVVENEKLWNIAREMRGNRDVTIPQIMMALLRNNPEAFYRNNVNNLKQGYVLRIENPQDIYAMDADEARIAFKRQYQLWQDYKQQRAESAAKIDQRNEQARSKKPGQIAKAPVDANEGVLTLERPQGKERIAGHLESSQPGQGKESEQLGKLRADLAAAEKDAELSQKRNEEMHARLLAMEDQIASLQRLMQIKSDELVALQQNKGLESPAMVVPSQSEDEASGAQKLKDRLHTVLTELQKNPQLMGIVGGITLLLLSMFWVIARRRRTEREGDYRFSSERSTAAMDDYEEPDYGVSAARSIEEDPLTQADIFVAYGNLDAAVNLMSSAVDKHPQNIEYQNKLDHLAMMLSRRDSAESNAEPIMDTPVAETELPIEEESLLTSDDLAAFQHEFENTQSSEQLSTEADFAVETSSRSEMSMLDEMDSISVTETDSVSEAEPFKDLGQIEEKASDVNMAEAVSAPPAEEIEFDLGNLDDELQLLANDSAMESSSDEAVVEFDLDELNEMSDLLDAEDSVEEKPFSITDTVDDTLAQTVTETVVDSADDDGLFEIGDHEPDMLNDVDEVGTKLDLARAYIDMGDPEGARDILDEVLLEGNSDQISQAHELLDQI